MRTSRTLLPGSGSTAASARDFFARDSDTVARAFPRTSPHFIGWRRSAGVNLQLLEEVRKINDTQREVFFNKIRSVLWTLRGKRLAALGLAFKGDTDDIRDSPAIEIVKQLLHAGAIVSAYDPAAMERAKEVLPPAANMQYAGDLYQAAKDADALLILTDWKEFACHRFGAVESGPSFPHHHRRSQSV